MSNRVRKIISDKIGQIRGMSLRAKSARAAMTLGVGTSVERGLRLVRNMILARILAPDQFGLMAIVMVAVSVFEAFTEVGVKQSVIQNKQGADPEYLNVAWWFQAIRGLGLFGIAFFLAPWISSFYDKPELLRLLRVSFLAMVFRGLVSPRMFVLEKEYKFGRAVLLTQGSGIFGTLVAVVLAFMMRNVWALVAGSVAEFAFMCVLSYLLVPFKPTLKIHRGYLSELFGFTRGMFGLPILTMVSLKTDALLLGKLVPAVQLGMYTLAYGLAEQPAWLFHQIIGRILLPAFAEDQDNNQILRSRVRKIAKATFVFGVPLVALAAIWAGPLLSLIYGRRYTTVAMPFRILCVTMFVRIQAQILVTIYLAIGKPHLYRRIAAVLAILVVCLMYPGIRLFGLEGAAGVLLLSNTVALCMQVIWMRGTIGLRFQNYAFFWRRGTTP
ncbi:MAG: hypothetical protein AMJ75_07630 [Phycisphaerae bacterium SM1_79]|nr:MAG: hypothetical protein AMJ75_07630 [Phycisphaerae bacterium SM1_79]